MTAPPFQDAAKRIEAKSVLIPFCGCRIWLGASVHSGYGVMSYMGRQTYTHRVAWALANGDVPSGMFVMHRCDTPACVNVDHLVVGTPRDNSQDMVRKARARGGAPREALIYQGSPQWSASRRPATILA